MVGFAGWRDSKSVRRAAVKAPGTGETQCTICSSLCPSSPWSSPPASSLRSLVPARWKPRQSNPPPLRLRLPPGPTTKRQETHRARLAYRSRLPHHASCSGYRSQQIRHHRGRTRRRLAATGMHLSFTARPLLHRRGLSVLNPSLRARLQQCP